MKRMSINEFQDKHLAGRLSRREALRVLTSAGVVATSAFVGGHARAGEKLTVYEWGGYDVPELFPSFYEKHGEPDFSLYANQMEMLAKLSHGFKVDIAHSCTESLTRMSDLNLLRPIDTDRLSNWGSVFARLRNLPDIRDKDGNVVMIPTDWGNSSIIYRTDIIDIAPDDVSWCMLFDERYEGRLASIESEEAFIAAGLCHGFGDKVFDMTDAMLAELRPLIEKQAKLVRFYSSDQTTIVNALASGEVVAAMGWSTSITTLRDQGVSVAYANPKEGLVNWLCGFSILPSSEIDEDLIYEFLDAWLDPRAGRYLIEEQGMGHSSAEAFKAADPELVDALGFPSNPDTMLDRGIMYRPMDPKVQGKMMEMLDEVRAEL